MSHETIYRSLYVQTRGVLKKELIRHLRSKRTMRRPRRAGDKRGQIVDLVSISKRPATVEDRAVPGHWEGDLLSGSKNSYIAYSSFGIVFACLISAETTVWVSLLATFASVT